jgi:hypothetical protein
MSWIRNTDLTYGFMWFQGLKARVLYQMPSTAIAWSVYEGFKHVINNYSSTAAVTQHPYDTLASEIRDRGGSAASGGGLSSAPGHAVGVGGLTKFAYLRF